MTRTRLCQPSTAANVRILGVESKLMVGDESYPGKPPGWWGVPESEVYASAKATNMPEQTSEPTHCPTEGYPRRRSRGHRLGTADCEQKAVFRNPAHVT